MKTIGLDIGTTTISAVVYDPQEGAVMAKNVKNDSFLPGQPWERLQDPKTIWEKVRRPAAGASGSLPRGCRHRRHRADARHRVPGRIRRAGQPPVHLAGRTGRSKL